MTVTPCSLCQGADVIVLKTVAPRIESQIVGARISGPRPPSFPRRALGMLLRRLCAASSAASSPARPTPTAAAAAALPPCAANRFWLPHVALLSDSDRDQRASSAQSSYCRVGYLSRVEKGSKFDEVFAPSLDLNQKANNRPLQKFCSGRLQLRRPGAGCARNGRGGQGVHSG